MDQKGTRTHQQSNPSDCIAIPTEYRGHRFRSRLEARWACFFDNCGWPWEYEPFDLDGYIPDFVLTFPHAPILVEVKPVLYMAEFKEHWPKIKQSGWDHEAMIVGARIFKTRFCGDPAVIGCHSERETDPDWPAWLESEALLHTCFKCKAISFHNHEGSWRCRVNGCYDGDAYVDYWGYEEARKLFADCGGVVQWNT